MMGFTNQVIRQFVGKASPVGFEGLDYGNKSLDAHVLNNGIKKMDDAEKRAFAEKRLSESETAKVV
ncbi:hypothetical protein V5F53_05060 [Xanthobacter sp. V4C-4]|uniref:hypothetical protein n=1 Tax=Xanthobacter cornucopiae TaxID=3119924 RepID=UPI00372715CE